MGPTSGTRPPPPRRAPRRPTRARRSLARPRAARSPACRPPGEPSPRRSRRLAPAEVAVEPAFLEQALEVLEPGVARPVEVLPVQPDLAVRGRELRRSSPRVPLRL